MVARVAVEIDLDWPTWSQTAWRSWSIGEPVEDPPQILLQITLRLARLASRPDPARILSVLPDGGPALTGDALERGHVTIEEHVEPDGASFAVEVPYEGTYDIDDVLAEKGTATDGLAVLGPWIASRLVSLADLELPYLPPDPVDDIGR
jgi:hypothetical protein